MAHYLHDKIPGVRIPASILERFDNSPEESYEELGIEIALELIEKIKTKKGINGIHLMAVGWESVVPRLIADAGLKTH
jgi:methylenetetrahydrofolate reductase (NADPH)